MIRSLVLFVHITGVLTMFAGLALEASGAESAGKATPRISGIAAALTLLSGFYLGARFGVLGNAWMRASYAAIVVMMAAGSLARRSDALRQISLRLRAAFGLAIVFLMVAKPDALRVVGRPGPGMWRVGDRRAADRAQAAGRPVFNRSVRLLIRSDAGPRAAISAHETSVSSPHFRDKQPRPGPS